MCMEFYEIHLQTVPFDDTSVDAEVTFSQSFPAEDNDASHNQVGEEAIFHEIEKTRNHETRHSKRSKGRYRSASSRLRTE